jgi:UDP-N-acetylmuramoylalanine--D-glutamate ligase
MTLFGYGKTNQAIAKEYGNCNIFDDKFVDIKVDGSNKLLPTHLFDPDGSDIEIITPGIPPHHPLAMSAKNLISDYDFFYKYFPYSVWISGTNGKTTTTQMMTHVLKDKGAICGGNIGTPVCEMDREANIWILETSSFTLHYTKIAKPNIYVLLPITPDHISWHGSLEEYEKAKLKPLDSMKESEVAIIPAKYADYPTNAHKITYTDSLDLANKLELDIDKIDFKDPFLLDALLALAVSKVLFDEVDYELINSFETDPHKLEEVLDNVARIWVNDSKATNIDATIEAIKRYKDKKIYIILGGDDKGVALEPLFEYIKDKDISIYAIGSNTKRLISLAGDYNIESHECYRLDEAVVAINLVYNKDDNSIAMLSPAAASLDQFSGYKQRGEKFKEFLSNLSNI